jgi:hypothetical protein
MRPAGFTRFEENVPIAPDSKKSRLNGNGIRFKAESEGSRGPVGSI